MAFNGDTSVLLPVKYRSFVIFGNVAGEGSIRPRAKRARICPMQQAMGMTQDTALKNASQNDYTRTS